MVGKGGGGRGLRGRVEFESGERMVGEGGFERGWARVEEGW